MAERKVHAPTAPPASAMATSGSGENPHSFGSAREGTALHLQQLAHEQRDLGAQLHETVSRLMGVNQQLADSAVFGEWFGNAPTVSSQETEKARQALALAEAEANSLKEDVRRLEAEKNSLQRQLHRAMTSNASQQAPDRTIVVQLQDDLSRAQRLVRTKETLLAAMMSELESVKSQLSDTRVENERLSEQVQQMSGPLASSLQLPLAARFTNSAGDFSSADFSFDHEDEADDETDLPSPSEGRPEKTSVGDMNEQELRSLLRKKERQMAEVVKINQQWERQYKRQSTEMEKLKADRRGEGKDDINKHRKKSRHQRSDGSSAELQAELEASRRETIKAQERSRMLEQKLREKQRSLAEETEQHQLALAKKESLEVHMKGNGDAQEQVRQLQQQLDALRKELQTSMNSETRVREELSASQAALNSLRQHAAGDSGHKDQASVKELQSELATSRDRIAALETQIRLSMEDFRREQKDKQRLEQQLTGMRSQLQHLLQGAGLQMMGPASQPGRGPAVLFSGERAEIDNDDTVPEAQLDMTRAPASSIDIVCLQCNKRFDQRVKLLDHMMSCRPPSTT